MPHDAITLKQEVVEKTSTGGHDLVLLHKYEAPSTADERVAEDPNRERDLAAAATMMKWLNREYPGYPWATACDTKQGIAKISIPILMGIEHWFVINLHTHDIIDGLKIGAGEILERYRQSREGFNLGAFLEARAKHSKLIIPKRLVPQ